MTKLSKVKNEDILLREVVDPKKDGILLSQIQELEKKLSKKAEEIADEEIFKITNKITPLSPLISEMRK